MNVSYPPILGFTISQNPSLIEYVKYFFNLGMAVAGTLAVLVIVFGGIYYLISLGRGKFTEEGKNWVKSGIVGLLILLSAYLIAYTINPDLVILRLEQLWPLRFGSSSYPPGSSQNPPVTSYQEIPIGILTENLLARTMDCYDFDNNGDPIEGGQITTDDNKNIAGPTYLEHDRVDCALKLGQAAEKKAQIVEKLSDEIIKLMELCSCAGSSNASDCKNNCDKDGKDCLYPEDGTCPRDKKDIGATAPCEDTCSKSAGCSCQGPNCQCCPVDAKEKIEHGPIKIADCNGLEKEYKGLDEFRSQFSNNYDQIKNKVEVQPPPKLNGKEITIINSPWYDLRLIDQLTYLKGKMDETKQKVKQDLDNLDKGRDALAQCSTKDMEKSSVDIMHIQEETKKENKTIDIKKDFKDPETQQIINASKYCNGFNYANSSCFQQCQNACPDTSQQALTCYGECGECDPSNSDYSACSNDQEECIEDCFNSRPCIFGTSGGNFQQCISSCRSQCSDNCSKIYSDCSGDLKNCQDQCNNDSKCVLDNLDKCLINSQFFQQCGNQTNDSGNLKNCIDNSYLCKYGSHQNAGYPDCLDPDYPKNNYSASFLYKHPEYQKCPNPYQPNPGSSCSNEQNPDAACLQICPQTIKCPASSQCPECPCDIVSKTDPKKITEYRVVAGQCSNFTYSSDPLTFYCRINWEPQAPLSGKWIQCKPENEIPVGQTVDDTKKWGQDFMDNIDKLTKKVQDMIEYMKKINEEKNYCQCDSKCDTAGEEPTCQAKCAFQQTEATTTTETYPDGSTTTVDVPPKCWCARQTCSGNPCQKIINLLQGKASDDDCPKGTEYKGIKYYHDQIDNGVKDFMVFALLEGRSDILKELTYSRKKMDECSRQSTGLGGDAIKTFSCTKAYLHTICLSKRCYGILDGQVKNRTQTDNWFCAKTLLK